LEGKRQYNTFGGISKSNFVSLWFHEEEEKGRKTVGLLKSSNLLVLLNKRLLLVCGSI